MSRWQTSSGRWFSGVARTRWLDHCRMWGPRVWSLLRGGRATLALLGAVSVLALVAVTLALVSVAHAGPPSWTIHSSPNPNFPPNSNQLLGVAVHAPHDVWAVGTTASPTGLQTLTLHWAGQ